MNNFDIISYLHSAGKHYSRPRHPRRRDRAARRKPRFSAWFSRPPRLPVGARGWKIRLAERSNHSNLCRSELRQNSIRIQEKLSEFFWIRNFETLRNSQHFLEYNSAKFRENLIRIGTKSDGKYWQITILQNFEQKIWRKTIDEKFRKFWDPSVAKDFQSCRSRKILKMLLFSLS